MESTTALLYEHNKAVMISKQNFKKEEPRQLFLGPLFDSFSITFPFHCPPLQNLQKTVILQDNKQSPYI